MKYLSISFWFAVVMHAMGQISLSPPLYSPASDSSLFDNSLFDGSSFDGSSFDGSSFDGSSFDGSSFDGSSFGGPAIDGPAIGNPPPGNFLTPETRPLVLLPEVTQPTVSVTISPTNAIVRLGDSISFGGWVHNSTNRTIIWTVNNIPGGNTNIGTITNGIYQAPLVPITGDAVKIGAISQVNPKAVARATVSLHYPIPSITSVTPTPITFGTRTVTITGTGFVPATIIRGNYSNTYSAIYLSPTKMKVTGLFSPSMTRLTEFYAINTTSYWSRSPNFAVPTASAGTSMTYLAACRLLEQATWGPDATNVDHLQTIGIGEWWREQLANPASTYWAPDDPNIGLSYIQAQFLSNALNSSDQLRQRMAFSLSSFIVVSGLKLYRPDWYAPYLNVLSKDAFGTYANLLTDITLCPSMAKYLDLADNDKANPITGTAPNENFARELMQLFTVGTVQLNLDGTAKLDTNGLPIPTYEPELIPEMARVFTGWTYPGDVNPRTGHAALNFSGQMQATEANHDHQTKTILGGITLPAGQTARQDLDATIAALVQHPNTAPFVSTRLIQRLVMGNPSPAYVSRVASVFVQSGGNLSAVLSAVLFDWEARRGNLSTNPVPSWGGHLREPVLYTLAILRATGTPPLPFSRWDLWTDAMGQRFGYPPSVFGFYSPNDTTDLGVRAPEFRLLSEPTALIRVNFVNSLVNDGLSNYVSFNSRPFANVANSNDSLLTALNNAFFYGNMPSDVNRVIGAAIASETNLYPKIFKGIYLSVTANAYQVQH